MIHFDVEWARPVLSSEERHRAVHHPDISPGFEVKVQWGWTKFVPQKPKAHVQWQEVEVKTTLISLQEKNGDVNQSVSQSVNSVNHGICQGFWYVGLQILRGVVICLHPGLSLKHRLVLDYFPVKAPFWISHTDTHHYIRGASWSICSFSWNNMFNLIVWVIFGGFREPAESEIKLLLLYYHKCV